MSTTNTGGPAFPSEHQTNWSNPGMTVLDYFAAHAPAPPDTWRARNDAAENIIEWRWAYAEAMVKEKKARQV